MSSSALRRIALVQLGVGRVGQALVQLVRQQQRAIEQRQALRLTYVGIADSSRLVWSKGSLSDVQLAEILQSKLERRSPELLRMSGGHEDQTGSVELSLEVVQAAHGLFGILDGRLAEALQRCDDRILIDVTAADEMAPLLAVALDHGWGVALANKKPLVIPVEQYRRLRPYAGRRLRYEATVGAGLPVVATLQQLLDTGDEVTRIDGAFSGTLGYLCTCLQNGQAFSAAVREAHTLGFTEPDPRDDLGGMDVARKALILVRTLGHNSELADVEVEALFPPSMASSSPAQFMASLEHLDQEFEEKVTAAQGRNSVLRYVAHVEDGHCRVGLREIDSRDVMAALRGPDNIIRFRTRHYSESPLVIVGPGAGPEVTAAGVLADVLALARQRP